jgi:hypothetical protein
MSRSVPSSSGRDANDYASGSRNTNFKPLVLGEIQAVGDTASQSWRFGGQNCQKVTPNCIFDMRNVSPDMRPVLIYRK